MRGRRLVALFGLGILAVQLTCIAVSTEELEGLDVADEPVNVLSGRQADATSGFAECDDQCKADKLAAAAAAQNARPRSAAAAENARPSLFSVQQQTLSPGAELVAAALAVVYVVVAFFGASANHRLAVAWAKAFAGPDGFFARQFAACGAGAAEAGREGVAVPLVKESASCYKFYASGRRFCEGCLVTLNLRSRPDLLAWLVSLVAPAEDLLEAEVYLGEQHCPPMVLAVGTPRQIRSLTGRRTDLSKLAKPVKVPTGAAAGELAGWPHSKLQVVAEHGSLVTELLGDPRVAPLFTSPQHADKLKYFRALTISDQDSDGSHKRVLRLTLALPPSGDMAGALGPLLGLMTSMVDLVGVYKLSPELKKRAVEARARLAAEGSGAAEEARRARVEALAARKQQKLQEEKERIARLPPDARRKAEEKLAKQAAKKSMRIKMVKM